MLELGKKSDQLHKNLSKVINNSDIDKVFIKGQKTLSTYKNINIKKRGNIFQQDEDIDFTLNNIIANNDYLMIKGSNATGLNNYSKRIIKVNLCYLFFTSLIDQYSFLNVFKYLTFRTGLSVMTSLVVVFIIGAPLIKFSLKNDYRTNQTRRAFRHIVKKSGTPTMEES